jgi:hypothetical protein
LGQNNTMRRRKTMCCRRGTPCSSWRCERSRTGSAQLGTSCNRAFQSQYFRCYSCENTILRTSIVRLHTSRQCTVCYQGTLCGHWGKYHSSLHDAHHDMSAPNNWHHQIGNAQLDNRDKCRWTGIVLEYTLCCIREGLLGTETKTRCCSNRCRKRHIVLELYNCIDSKCCSGHSSHRHNSIH